MKSNTNKKIRISIVISIISLFASILLTFVFNKFLLDQPQIGDVNFGLKSTVDSLTSFVSIFVLGMSSTFIRFHRKYEHDEKSLFSSFNIIVLVIAGLALIFGLVLVLLSVNNVILDPSKGIYSQKQVHDFVIILVVSLLFLILSIILSCNKWYLESIKSIIFVRVVNLVCIITYPIISIIFVLCGADMIGVTIIYSAVYLCGFLSYLIYRLIKTKKQNPFVIRGFKKEIIKEILIFAFFVVIASFIETFNHSVDKIILTIGFGAAYTTLYQLSMSINQVLLSLCDTLYAPYVPYISDDAKNNDVASTQQTYDKVSFLLLLLSFTLIIGFFAAGKDFVILWLGEARIDVYYYALIIFLAWPVYCIAKFSLQIHRAYNKHYKSALLFVLSFVVHLIVTFSLVWLVGVWACIIGTAISMLFLGISFIFYNKKAISLKQKYVIETIVRFCLASIATCLLMYLFNNLIAHANIESHFLLLLIKGFVSVCLWAVFICFVFFKKIKLLVKKFFYNQYDASGMLVERCIFERFKDAIVLKKEKINSFFSIVMICYFLINFASYYLGGISSIQNVISSPVFEYGTKFISYILIIAYFCFFYIANGCTFNRTAMILVAFSLICSVVSAIVVPKQLSIQMLNKYNVLVEYKFTAGFLDVFVGIINYAIDLFVMLFFAFYLRKALTYKNIRPFIIFIILFAIFECVYSFVFDIEDYLYFFKENPDTSSGFNGYTTNISGTFQSKNGFGFLLFGSFVASVFDVYQSKKWYFVVPAFVIFVVSVFSLCKTALISIVLFGIFTAVAFLIHLHNRNKKTYRIALISICVLACCFGLIFTPFARNVNFIDKIANKIISFFIVSGEATTRSRTIIWLQTMQLLKGPFVIIGYGKTISLNMLSLATNMTTLSFHNSFLNTLCCYGAVGVLVYLYSLWHVFSVLKCIQKRTLFIVMIGVMISSFLYGMMEVATLFVSSSSVLIVSNIILSLHVEGCKEKKVRVECYEVINI